LINGFNFDTITSSTLKKEIKMFVIQRLYAGNKYLSELADKRYSSDINKAFCFVSLQHAKAVKKGLNLFNVRIINMEMQND